MVMQAMRTGAKNTIIKYTLFGILMLASFGLIISDTTGLLGTRTIGISSSDVARVGDNTLSIQSFDRNLRASLNRLGIQPSEAYKLGFVEQLAGSELSGMVIGHAASEVGIEIGRPRVATQIMSMIQPMVGPGQNPKDVLNQLLTSQGLSEADLTTSIQREMGTGLMANTMQGAFSTLADPLLVDLYKVDNEKRTLEYVVFMDKDVKNIPEPSDADLQKLYDSVKENFAIPERRTLRIVKLNEDSVRKTISVTKEEVLRIYEQTKESYFTPPARLLHEALLENEADARKVYDLAAGGTALKNAVTQVTGRNIAYLGEKTVPDNELRPEIEEAALAVSKPGTALEPVQTPIGWYVVVVKKIVPGGYKPFDDLRKELEADLFENKFSDAIYDVATKVDDLLAGGATLEDLKKQVDVTVIDMPSVNAFGQDEKGNNALKAFEKIAPAVLETGFQLGEGETSPVSEMADRSYAAITAVKVEPKSYQEFASVKSELGQKWKEDFARSENRGMVNKYLNDIKADKLTLDKAAQDAEKTKQTARALGRQDAPPKPFIPEMANLIFTSPARQPFLIPADGGVVLARISEITWPEKVDTNSSEFKAFRGKAIGDTRNEALMAYVDFKHKEFGAVLNRELLQKTYGRDPNQDNTAP